MSALHDVASPLPVVKEPMPYNFNGWDNFYENVMQYHNATRPDDKLVSDRIETFRRFMSMRVTRHLKGYLEPHPRYKTTVGWELWTADVRKLVSKHDKSAKAPSSLKNSEAHCKAANTTPRGYWKALDKLVVREEISSADQRRLFWDTLSQTDQSRLVGQCSYFDPDHGIWEKGPDVTKEAEQQLWRIMEHLTIDDEIVAASKEVKLYMRQFFVCAALTVTLYWFSTSPASSSRACRYGQLTFGLFTVISALCALDYLSELRTLQRSKRNNNCLADNP